MLTVGYEGQLILNFLKSAPTAFFSPVIIARKAGQRGQFRKDPHWAKPALLRLAEAGLVETDASGHYRLAPEPEPKPSIPLAPHIAEALVRSGKVFDLTQIFLEEKTEADPAAAL